MSFELERFGGSQGSLELGWIEPGIFYVKLSGAIHRELADRFVERFTALIGDSVAIRYFADWSELSTYDYPGMGAVLGAVLAKRAQFQLVIARTWGGAVDAKARAYGDALGCLEYVLTAQDFELRLRAAAPRAAQAICRLAVAQAGGQLAVAVDAARHGAPASEERGTVERQARARTDAAGVTYAYVFDLTHFEEGTFVATRFPYLTVSPGAGWLCLARDDAHALELARRAALVEWAPPAARRPDDFSVKFVSFAGRREPHFDRRR
jgi:hypothetical protein